MADLSMITEHPQLAPGRVGRVAALVAALMLPMLALWAALTPISGAVVASGTVAAGGKPKSVQHLDGGIVQEIFVADGDHVAQGQEMFRLDDTLLSANLEIYRNRLAEAFTRRARLKAERDGATRISFPEAPALLGGLEMEPFEADERLIFEARADLQAGRKAQLVERIEQFHNQIDGVQALIAAKSDQIAILKQDLARQQGLKAKQLAREGQLLSIQANLADLRGQVAEHRTEAARIGNSINDTKLEIGQTERQFRADVVTELREVNTQIEELTQQITSTARQLQRVDIRAPVEGYVHEMQIVTIGGVLAPGGTVAQIIPSKGGLDFELRVAPASIDQVHLGQDVRLRFPAFSQRTTPEISGEVANISPSTVVDEATGAQFYRIEARAKPEELAKLGDKLLVPGMPVEAYIQIEERPALSYLTKPLADHIRRAFREE
ncbi:MAG: HlyD family type I secretion periplasmic adaptor subunit [Thioclava marina]|uniref:HlyD family type I secretion periplasmic adaptor subunit n=1 Tax=Thioclava marina TaxID=1915077 RepID=UPI00198621D2|nr:HlyD family type I secretion periplasmic adaptor subunit [Thioclava marina]MBC7147687.1 HlyD family type I secretion periplasmic adaptor subunit [Thioclava marina]